MKAIQVLRHYVKPSMGCTEPAAVGLAAATARRAVPGDVKRIEVIVDGNVYRNGLGVGVPGAGKHRGNLIAAALGAVGGDADLGLEVFRAVTPEHLEQAESLVSAGSVTLLLDRRRHGPYVAARVDTSNGVGRAVIEGSHTQVVQVERNGKRLQVTASAQGTGDGQNREQVSQWLRRTTVGELLTYAEQIEQPALEFALQGIAMNERAAQEGLNQASGLAVGAHLMHSARQYPEDMRLRAQVISAAAVDARMAGTRIQVMTSSGSGNQGIMATLPPLAAARSLGVDDIRLGQAVTLSHFLLARMTEELGLLTPLCGSAMQAASAASAAITWLLGGDAAQIEKAASVTFGTQASVLCDGAKASCALKAANAADVAVRVASLTVDGFDAGRGTGLIGKSLLDTVRAIAFIAQDMETASQRILDSILSNAS